MKSKKKDRCKNWERFALEHAVTPRQTPTVTFYMAHGLNENLQGRYHLKDKYQLPYVGIIRIRFQGTGLLRSFSAVFSAPSKHYSRSIYGPLGWSCQLNFFYMKYSVMPENISSFVVGRTRSECGLPMAVI